MHATHHGSWDAKDRPGSNAKPRSASIPVRKIQRKARLDKGFPQFKDEDYYRFKWPLPKMFGDEDYAYTDLNIKDLRYKEEIGEMSKTFADVNHKQMLVERNWRIGLQMLLNAEYRLSTLSKMASEKTRTKFEKAVSDARFVLLRLQVRRNP